MPILYQHYVAMSAFELFPAISFVVLALDVDIDISLTNYTK